MYKGVAALVISLWALPAWAGAPAPPDVSFLVEAPTVKPVAYLKESATDIFGTPLGGPNPLVGCWYSITDNQGRIVANGWTRPTSPAGGGSVRIPEIDQFTIGQSPYVPQAGCCAPAPAGCGPTYHGHINWTITVP